MDGKHFAGLEPAAAESANRATSKEGAAIIMAAAAASAAITFKRLVDMVEPFARVAYEELKAEQAKKKGKG